MSDLSKSTKTGVPMLFPCEPEQFLESIRKIIREEIAKIPKQDHASQQYVIPGMDYKPLYKIAEVCTIFQVSKPTIYDWIKHGKLKPFKVRSRVYFLWQDIQKLLPGLQNKTIPL
jgi:excisionase family DNA binding protein